VKDEKNNKAQTIEDLADVIVTAGMCQLPDVTPLQKLINRLYAKLRICGMPAEEVSVHINSLLSKHGITKKQIFPD